MTEYEYYPRRPFLRDEYLEFVEDRSREQLWETNDPIQISQVYIETIWPPNDPLPWSVPGKPAHSKETGTNQKPSGESEGE